jgi:hypothetical protein
MEGDEPTRGTIHVYVALSHEPLCSYLKQTKMSFICPLKQRTGVQTRCCLGVGTSGSGEDIRKGLEGECGGNTFSCVKRKNETCWNCSRRKGIKENDGECGFN